MATEKITKNVNAKDLTVNGFFKVKYSTFKKVNGKRGAFMSASFIVEDVNGEKFWVSTPSENSALKAIGIMTSAINADGDKFGIIGLTPVERNGYVDFIYTIAPYTSNNAPF